MANKTRTGEHVHRAVHHFDQLLRAAITCGRLMQQLAQPTTARSTMQTPKKAARRSPTRRPTPPRPKPAGRTMVRLPRCRYVSVDSPDVTALVRLPDTALAGFCRALTGSIPPRGGPNAQMRAIQRVPPDRFMKLDSIELRTLCQLLNLPVRQQAPKRYLVDAIQSHI